MHRTCHIASFTMLIVSMPPALLAGDRREHDRKLQCNYAPSPTVVIRDSPSSRNAPAGMPIIDVELDEKEKKSHKEAASHEREIKARAEMSTFGPSFYSTKNLLMRGHERAAITIRKTPRYIWWREWDFTNHITREARTRGEMNSYQNQETAVLSGTFLPHLSMSNGERAISITVDNALAVHHFGPFVGGDRSPRRTTIKDHMPYFEYLCAVNPSCTRVLTVARTLAYLVLHKITYQRNGSVKTTRHVYAEPVHREQIPLYFSGDEEFVSLSIAHGGAVYRVNLTKGTWQKPSWRPLFDGIQALALFYEGCGLKALIQTAGRTEMFQKPEPEMPTSQPEQPLLRPEQQQSKHEAPRSESASPRAMPKLIIPKQLAEHAIIHLQSVAHLPE